MQNDSEWLDRPINRLIETAQNIAKRPDLPSDLRDWARSLGIILTEGGDKTTVRVEDLRLLSWARVDEPEFLVLIGRTLERRHHDSHQ